MKKATLEIKQILDLNDPLSKLMFTLGLLNICVILVSSKVSVFTLENVFQRMVNILFLLYVLSCFKNGNCNIFAFILSVMSIALMATELFMRIIYA